LTSIIIGVSVLLGAVFLTIILRNQALAKNCITAGLVFVVLCYSDPLLFEDIRFIVEVFVALVAFFYLLRSNDKTGSEYVFFFNSSFLLSCISVFDNIFVVALPFILFVLLFYSSNNFRHWIISIIAMAVPWVLYYCFCFLTSRPFLFSIDLKPVMPEWDLPLILQTVEFFIGVVAFIFGINTLRGDIIFRRKTSLFLFAFVYFSAFGILFYEQPASHIMFPIISAFVIGKLLNYPRIKWIAEITLLALIAAVLII
jgi:hypothetical protein